MVDAAAGIKNGIKVDRHFLNIHPAPDGLQHDERRSGFPLLTKWLFLTWKKKSRKIPGPKTKLHGSVYKRMQLPGVIQFDAMSPYRPEALRSHEKLASYYSDVTPPAERSRLFAFVSRYFVGA
jgi:hypothetical protein